jgi:type I restriction enzyme S subunit
VTSIPLSELFAIDRSSVDPRLVPNEDFELWSIPSYDEARPEISKGSSIGSAKTSVRPGDVLLSRIVPHIRRAWVVQPSRGLRQIASSEWIVFRSDAFVPEYLRHFLLSDVFHSQFMNTVAGVGGSLLRARPSAVGQINAPLPSKPEQRRIAAILDQADALRRKRRIAISRLDDLAQAAFRFLLESRHLSGTANWKYDATLGDIAEIASGVTIGRKLQGQATRVVPYLAVANVQDRSLRLEAVKSVAATEDEIQRFRLAKDDLLLTEGGDPDKLGRGTLWDESIVDCIHQNHIFRVRVKSADVEPLYLNWLVGSAYGKRYFLRSAKQTTGIASINKGQLSRFPLLMPPLELQRRFVRFIIGIERMKGKQAVHLKELEALFGSLQESVFISAETVPNTPSKIAAE